MNWLKLLNNQCPKCNRPLSRAKVIYGEWGKIGTFSYLPPNEYAFICKCAFVVRGSKMREVYAEFAPDEDDGNPTQKECLGMY